MSSEYMMSAVDSKQEGQCVWYLRCSSTMNINCTATCTDFIKVFSIRPGSGIWTGDNTEGQICACQSIQRENISSSLIAGTTGDQHDGALSIKPEENYTSWKKKEVNRISCARWVRWGFDTVGDFSFSQNNVNITRKDLSTTKQMTHKHCHKGGSHQAECLNLSAVRGPAFKTSEGDKINSAQIVGV